MLEQIRERAQGPWSKVILVLITVPFALVGLESYFSNTDTDKAVASFGKQAISVAEYDQTLKQQQDQYRQMLGKNYDPAMFDTPEVRQSIIDRLVEQRLVANASKNANVRATDAQIFERVETEPTFLEDGKFSKKKFDEFAKRYGGATVFEARLRDDIQTQAYGDAVTNTAFTSRTTIEHMIRMAESSRDISVISYAPENYKTKVQLDDAKLQAYYESNKAQFQIPEQIKVEYIELSADALSAQAKVDPADVAKFYEKNKELYTTKEERKASHILIGAAKDAKADVKAAAKEKAGKIFEQVKANPALMAELAKKESSDTGSAQTGGDLGFFGKGMMVAPFEAAAYGAQKGDIVGPIETDFGFHIIQVTDIKAGSIKPIDQVRPEIEAELKKTAGQTEFAKKQPEFSEAVFTDPNSLKSAADKTKLPIVTTGFFAKGQPSVPQLTNPKLVAELFSDEVKKNKKNTSAVDVGNNTFVSARVVELKEAVTRPFAEVKAQIEQRMMREETNRLAREEGESKLAQAQAKSGAFTWPAALTVTRAKTGGLPPDVVEKALKADAKTLPAYTGYATPQGTYMLIQISKVNDVVIDDTKRKEYADRMKQQQGTLDMQQLLASLKTETPVSVNKALLEKKPQ